MGELCTSMGKVASRFVEETIFGLSASGSVRLTEIGRSLEEDIALHATHKRLSRNLADKALASHIEKKVLQLGAKRITEKTLLIVDPTDLQKKYAKKMQYLANVRDASEKTIGKGYWMCDVVGCEVGSTIALILTLVPSLDTPVCDTETRRFNSEAAALGEDVTILAVSMDLPFAQGRWYGAAGVEAIETLSDHRDASMGEAYGALIKELGLLSRVCPCR